MPNTVKIVTDSASDIPESLAEKLNISVVPLTIRFGDHEYVDRVELKPDAFVQRMHKSAELPSTAAPSPGAFEAAFRQAKEDGFLHVVCITMSSKLSATFQAAANGAEFVSGVVDVRVIDSEQVTIAEAMMVHSAAEMAASGGDVHEIVEEIVRIRTQIRLVAALDTLENLRKGGRIGKAQAYLGSLLSIKPLIEIDNGEVKPLGRQRTWGRALEQLVRIVKDQGPLSHVAVGHVQAPNIEQFVEQLRPLTHGEPIPVYDVGPIIGTHGGAGLVGVAFLPKNLK